MDILNFTVDSALLQELGEKLVETVHIALVELVKNSYDADATELEIKFVKDEEGKSEIHVIDNGKGMNFQAVQDYWMRIATTNKEIKYSSTIFGRPLTGAKGIGRFSCRRLGANLKLITYGTEQGDVVGNQLGIERTEVEFPWGKFIPGTDVTDIKCEGSRLNLDGHTGTTLVIREINEEWNVRGWNWLKRQLAVLSANRGVQRANFPYDPGFNIKITAPDFEGGIRDIREDIINSGWGTLTAHINSKHQAVCVLEAMGIGRKTITSTSIFPHLKDVRLELGIMVSDRSQMRNVSSLSLGTLQNILPEWGGVQVRYKSFRVFPYGDDDWLEIDKDRGLRKSQSRINELSSFASTLRGVDPQRALLNLLSMRGYLGGVEIGEQAEGFEMKLNREGFIQSDAVEELKQFVRYAIDWSTIYRDYYLRQDTQEKSIESIRLFEDIIHEKLEPAKYVEAAVAYLEKEVKNIAQILPETERFETEMSFFRATDVIRKHNDTNKAELLHLRLVASTSTLLLIFSHEVKSLLGLLEQSKNSLTHLAAKLLPKERNEVLNLTGNFVDLKERLDDLLQMTSLVGTDQRHAKPGQVSIKTKITRVLKVFSLITKKYQITIDFSKVPNNIAIKNILEAEVYSILLNVLSNSIKSVIAGGKNRKIEFSAIRDDNKTILSIKDTGIGLDEDKFDDVFIPFVSDPDSKLYNNLEKRLNQEDKLIVGSGSGLGLGIVKEIINAHNGAVRFVTPDKGWNAELQILLP
ncbi:ATP-binding protein [Pedobacter sp.]|uniref:ATP-binding protein n=1 Tax=Pedobacter sp. TaxID=1411316 RepID=UPI003BA9632E